MTMPSLTIVIPTTAQKSRAECLYRAIESCLSQSRVSITVVVVANGNAINENILENLEKYDSVITLRIPRGHAPTARLHALQFVTTSYFGFLDDDDEFIADQLSDPLYRLENNPQLDAVIMPGLKKFIGAKEPELLLPTFPKENENPYVAMLHGNWLASCGGIYRHASIEDDIFSQLPTYFEWTHTALRLSSNKTLLFHQKSTFIINQTPDSLSSTEKYQKAEIDLFLSALKIYTLPKILENHFKKKLASKYNSLANNCLRKNDRTQATRYHLKCLISSRYGLSYLPWSRYLLKP